MEEKRKEEKKIEKSKNSYGCFSFFFVFLLFIILINGINSYINGYQFSPTDEIEVGMPAFWNSILSQGVLCSPFLLIGVLGMLSSSSSIKLIELDKKATLEDKKKQKIKRNKRIVISVGIIITILIIVLIAENI